MAPRDPRKAKGGSEDPPFGPSPDLPLAGQIPIWGRP